MSVLRPLDKLPGLNTATVLLVGTDDAVLQQLADSMLQKNCTSELRVHLAMSLPLPSSLSRPRIDLVVFVINLHSKYSLQNVEKSLCHVDASYFLGKVCFLATGGGGLPCHHGAAPGPHAADLRWPRARCLGHEPAVPAEELREPLPGGPVRASGPCVQAALPHSPTEPGLLHVTWLPRSYLNQGFMAKNIWKNRSHPPL
ncbi:centromere protein M isoform X1 [Ochotona curzoniae]|uniref:centromere protein M isoform X1 n=1 Tax=Ochotona curzoniae TaxID=130825 RepID=UPI001B34B276|nr:centromere protein M isoform X1 [Ochotona curzoniae]